MTVGVLAIMRNEAAYVARWVAAIRRGYFDQVIVVDGGSTDDTVAQLEALGVPVHTQLFANNFAEQRNVGIELCQTDWILEVDADEIPSQPLLAGLRDLAADADRAEVDCIGIGRLNFIDGVLVAGPGFKGLDYQYRLHNRRCRWEGSVHEEITGYRHRFEQPIHDGHFLIHDKTSERHNARNAFYQTLTR